MNHYMCSIYDNAAKAYLPPFVLPKIAMARRVFSDCINSPEHQFNKNPSDYTLFEIGLFDDNTGLIALLPQGPQKIVAGIELVIDTQPLHLELANGSSISPSLSDEASVQSSTSGDDPAE